MVERAFILLSLCGLLFIGALTGCGPHFKEWKPDEERHAYRVALRQVPPEPVYNRLTWVLPPDPLPVNDLPAQSGPVIYPVIHLQLANTTLEEAARALASSAHYESYCSSSIATKRISLSKLGNIDELAEALEENADIRVQVDHDNREVRFLPKPAPEPVFYGAASDANAPAAGAIVPAVNQDKVLTDGNQSTH